jgi:FkbM family methyltransferase
MLNLKNKIRLLFRYPITEYFLFLLSNGKTIDTLFGKLIPGNKLYPKDSLRNVKRNGIKYTLDISDYQNWLIYFGLTNDSPKGLYELAKDKKNIIDVGSNIGQTIMSLALICSKDAKLIGFEPDPVNYAMAVKNLNQNNFKNVKIVKLGLGSRNENLFLKINTPSNRGGNRITNETNSDSFKIESVKLDDYLINNYLNNIDLIKIDVEGFELQVLKGAEKTLINNHPDLFIEVGDENLQKQGSSPKSLILFIIQLGYSCFYATNKTEIEVSNTSFENCHFDMICIHQTKIKDFATF